MKWFKGRKKAEPVTPNHEVTSPRIHPLFSNLEGVIQKALTEEINKDDELKGKNFQIIDGFVMVQVNKSVGESLWRADSAVPSVCMMDKASSRLYFYAAKALLPDVDL